MNNYELINNEAESRYEFHIDGAIALVQYKMHNGQIYLVHTEVPEALEGRGIASALVTKVLEDIEAKALKMVPLCPYVQTYLKRHPEWNRLTA